MQYLWIEAVPICCHLCWTWRLLFQGHINNEKIIMHSLYKVEKGMCTGEIMSEIICSVDLDKIGIW
jgi:hypothetical protein